MFIDDNSLIYRKKSNHYKISEVIKSQGIDYKSNLTEIHSNALIFKQLQKEKKPKTLQVVDCRFF